MQSQRLYFTSSRKRNEATVRTRKERRGKPNRKGGGSGFPGHWGFDAQWVWQAGSGAGVCVSAQPSCHTPTCEWSSALLQLTASTCNKPASSECLQSGLSQLCSGTCTGLHPGTFTGAILIPEWVPLALPSALPSQLLPLPAVTEMS